MIKLSSIEPVTVRFYIDEQKTRPSGASRFRLRAVIDRTEVFASYFRTRLEARKARRLMRKFYRALDKRMFDE